MKRHLNFKQVGWILAALIAFSGLMAANSGSAYAAPGPGTIYLPVVSSGGIPGSAQVLPNSSTYFDGYFRRHIVGEVKNTGSIPLSSIDINVKYFDDTGQVVLEKTVRPYLIHLAPQDFTCFDVFVDEVPGFSRYEATIQSAMGNNTTSPNLTVSNINSQFDELSNGFSVSGSLKNSSTRPLQDIMLVVTLYNSANKVIDCDYNNADAPTLNPQETSPISLTLLKANTQDYPSIVANFRAQADGNFAGK